MTRSGGREVPSRREEPVDSSRPHFSSRSTESPLLDVVRDQELVGLIGLVQAVARQVHRRLGGRIDLDDLMGEGYLALVRCRERYDPAAGASLTTFAYRRIEGAMIDLARRERWFSESRYLAGGFLESFRDLLDGTAADFDADSAGRPDDARFTAQAVGRSAVVTMIRQSTDESVPDRVERSELRSLLADAIGRLSDQDRLVVRRLWFESRTLAELGQELGVSKEYARRLNMRALDRIRRLMAGHPMASCGPEADEASGTGGGSSARKGSKHGSAPAGG